MSKKTKTEEAAIHSGDDTPGGGDFVPPPDGDVNKTVDDGDEQFDAPDIEGSGEVSPFAAQIASVRGAIEARLASAAAAGARAANQQSDGPNVVGVGFAVGDPGSALMLPGEDGLVIYVEDESDDEEVRRELVDGVGIHEASNDALPLQIVATGVIEPLSSNRSKHRPAPAGTSVAHTTVTAGTIGAWARGNGNRSNRLLMLSNNHVLAASNRGSYRDLILQPGPADSGANPRDRIAILERYVRISFATGGINYVDAATGWCWPNLVRRDWVYHVGTSPRYFKCDKSILQPRLNMIVGKSGRTTNLTQGRISAVGVSINVNFGTAGVAHFRDQFSVRSIVSAPFSAGGDSGSLVWRWEARRRPVGLLFAGGGGTTFCNRMSRVLTALDIALL